MPRWSNLSRSRFTPSAARGLPRRHGGSSARASSACFWCRRSPAGCGRIIAVDLDQKKLDLACKLGADEGLRPDQVDVAAEVMRRTGGRAPTWRWRPSASLPRCKPPRVPAKRGPTHAGRPLGGEGRIADADHRHPRVDRQQLLHFLRRVSRLSRPDGTGHDRRRAFD